MFFLRRINKVELRFIFSIEPTFEKARMYKNRINTRVRCWSRGWRNGEQNDPKFENSVERNTGGGRRWMFAVRKLEGETSFN